MTSTPCSLHELVEDLGAGLADVFVGRLGMGGAGDVVSVQVLVRTLTGVFVGVHGGVLCCCRCGRPSNAVSMKIGRSADGGIFDKKWDAAGNLPGFARRKQEAGNAGPPLT